MDESISWQILISEWTIPLRDFVYSSHDNAPSSTAELAWEPFFILMCFLQHTQQVPKIETSFNYVKNYVEALACYTSFAEWDTAHIMQLI